MGIVPQKGGKIHARLKVSAGLQQVRHLHLQLIGDAEHQVHTRARAAVLDFAQILRSNAYLLCEHSLPQLLHDSVITYFLPISTYFSQYIYHPLLYFLLIIAYSISGISSCKKSCEDSLDTACQSKYRRIPEKRAGNQCCFCVMP